MTDENVQGLRISQLEQSPRLNDADIFPFSSYLASGFETKGATLSGLRSLLYFDHAVASIAEGVEKTVSGQFFHVWRTADRLWVDEYLNRDGVAEVSLNENGDQKSYPTPNAVIDAIRQATPIPVDSFEQGNTLKSINQALRWKANNNSFYSWRGVYPKVVPPNSTPDTTGGFGNDAWVDVTGITLRSELSSATGNTLIPTIGSNGYTPIGLDHTGTVDGNAIITAALASHNHIRLPPGVFHLGKFTIPSGSRLEGSGCMFFNLETKRWEGHGTLIIGNVDFTETTGAAIKNFTVDAFDFGGNAIQGLSARTGYIYVKNVVTRANNHGHLWEANDNNPANTNAIGNIVVKDCIHYCGPNGFVTKHKNVAFIRCQEFDVSIQGYVIASDNMNYVDPDNHSLGRTYSRAMQTIIQDCYHNNDRIVNPKNEGIRIYSRDYEPQSPSVFGVSDVRIKNFNGIGCAGNIIRAGEISNAPSEFAKVKSTDILFIDMPYNLAPFACIRLDSVNRAQFDNCLFGNQVNVELINNNEQINFSKNNRIKAGATLLGVEKCILTVSDNAPSLVPVAGQHVIDVRNTIVTSVTGLSYAVPGKEHTILINDNFTTINLGTPYRGYGTRLKVRYNGSSWDMLSISRKNTYNEFDRSSAVAGNSYDLQITSVGLMAHFINVNAGLTSITASDIASYLTGNDKVALRIRSNAPGTITIGGWSSAFKNAGAFTLSTTEKLMLEFTYDGASLVLTKSTQYT